MRGEPKFSDKTNITISINGQVGKEIREFAKKQGISTNAIVNKVLKDYVMFGKYFQDHIPVMIAPEIFSLLLEEVDEKTWLKSWDLALGKVVPQVFAMHNLEPTLENLVTYLLGDIGARAGIFEKFTCHKNQSGYKLVMIHPYDAKWSRVLASSLSKIFEGSFDARVKAEALPNSLTMDLLVHQM